MITTKLKTQRLTFNLTQQLEEVDLQVPQDHHLTLLQAHIHTTPTAQATIHIATIHIATIAILITATMTITATVDTLTTITPVATLTITIATTMMIRMKTIGMRIWMMTSMNGPCLKT